MYSRASSGRGLRWVELELGKKLLEVSPREFPLEGSSSLLIALLKSKQTVLDLRHGIKVIRRQHLALDD
jgi:hypothetical protein